MFVVDVWPSGRVPMFALSRPLNDGKPPLTAPACALPVTGSLPKNGAGVLKLLTWPFHVDSVKPRKYAQSCIRSCIAFRFATAAEMSLLTPGCVSSAGLHPDVNQAFVHGNA